MTEAELIKGCIEKNEDCQKQLFNLHAGRMMSVCLRYAADGQQAQDILQEGFIKVFSSIGQFRFEGSFEGWMRRVFVTVALRMKDKQKIYYTDLGVSDSEEQGIPPEVLSKISADEIHGLIRQMPDGYRTVFNLHAIEGYSHEEIAGLLGIQATTSRGQLLKARKYLQAMIVNKQKISIA